MPPKGKRVYISWDKQEERELRAWLARHKHLPWRKKCKEYLRQKKKPRSVSSIRSKYDQLEREGRLPPQPRKAATDTRTRRPPSLLSQLPPSPPPLVLPPLDPSVREAIQRWRRQMVSSEDIPAEHRCFSDDGSGSPATAMSSGHSSYTYDDIEVYDDESWDRLEWDAFDRQWGLHISEQPEA
ncbi:uncharacterized protein N7484_006089 [Penicillium longicatenatum]|uniref:uncharacterized protein n=1 Tax=Penicillium longicatenatum TaxID=1561947 RepID=UPI0025476465|nr:uncharacterized protein N7484_006089 [Penicillium longicatenatum]KAJ5643582.1 hypothetical protein N7484_006089 [Penicillium longicatenatum]